jgi:nitrogen regulatory protein PII
MTREGLTRMTKVEVVVAGEDVPTVRRVFESARATGWTSVSNVSGLGHHGLHQGGLLFNERAALELLITVVPDDRADALVAGLRELFAERSGVMFVSEVAVSRPEYFR